MVALVPCGQHRVQGQHQQAGDRRTSSSSWCCNRVVSCRAVSEHSKRQQAAGPTQHASQQEYPLVERMFDHNWRSPLAGHDHPDPSCRPVLALGKFDALHKGHQALAAAALQLGGTPVLLSFSGMASVLGWAPRKPLVAPCDRPRVLHLWAQQLAQQQLEQQEAQQRRKARRLQRSMPAAAAAAASSGPQAAVPGRQPAEQQQQQQLGLLEDSQDLDVVPVRQRYIPFAAVRSLSPEAFVGHIKDDFRAAGVVSGGNYRFGYKAAGDSALLQQLCGESGLPVTIVEMVGAATPGAVGPVSSTKIREMLDSCRIEAVKRCLGRPYCLVAELNLLDWQQQQLRGYRTDLAAVPSSSSSSSSGCGGSSSSSGGTSSSSSGEAVAAPPMLHHGWVFVPLHQLLNQHPAPGVFLCDLQLFVGATAHDDLLQLQQATASANSGSSSSSGGFTAGSTEVLPVHRGASSSSSGCSWCIRARQQQVEVVPDGVLVPKAIWEAAESYINSSAGNGTGSSSSTEASSSSSLRGTDPLVWDTDDREAEEDSGDEQPGPQSRGSSVGACSALLVLDIESCLMQMCVFS